MSAWNITFIIQKVLREVSNNHKREVVKNETVVNIEVNDTDLNLILNCKDASFKFSNDDIYNIDRKNILIEVIKDEMIKEYYVSSYRLDFTNRIGKVNLSYPKINLIYKN